MAKCDIFRASPTIYQAGRNFSVTQGDGVAHEGCLFSVR